MAVDAGTIYSEVQIKLDKLSGDVKSVKTNLDKITKASKDTAKKSQTSLSKFFSFIKTSGVGSFLALGAVVLKVTQYLGESAEAAADAQEVYSKFDTVFESIQASANATADAFADSFDLADSTARELLGTTGDLLTGFGATETQALDLSEKVNTLAGDLASFSNIEGGVSQASQALTAALLGEREQMKQLGIVVRETDISQKLLEKGQSDLTGQALLLAKAEATLELAYQQSEKAIGDYARTQDSAANAQRRAEESSKGLKEAIGRSFLNIVAGLRDKWSEVAVALTDVINNQEELREADKAVEAGTATYEQRLLVLQKQKEAVIDEAFEYKQLAEEGSRGAKTLLDQSNARLAAISAEIRAIGLQAQAEQIIDAEARAAAEERARIAAEEAKVQAQRLSDINFRKQVQEDLEDSLFTITQQELQAAEAGEEFNGAVERQQAAQSALNKLFDEGFRLAGPGVQAFISQYGDLLTVTEDVTVSYDELLKAAKTADEERISSSQNALAAQLELNGQFTQANLDTLLEQGRVTEEQYVELSDSIAVRNKATTEKMINDWNLYSGAVGGIVTSLATSLGTISDNEAEKELDNLQGRINAEEEGSAKRIALQEEYDAKAKALEKEQLKRKKAMATFQAIIDTASAIIGFLANPGGIPGIALSAAAGIAGIAQIAAIQSENVPNFETGGIVSATPGGSVIRVAENGSDEMMLNNGSSGQPMMREFAKAIVAEMGGAGGGTIVVQSYLDGKKVAENSAKYYNGGKVKLT